MNADVLQQIHHAANAMWTHVRVIATVRHGRSGTSSDPIDNIEERANERYRQTVHDKCAEASVDERDYWLAYPGEALIVRPACKARQFEQIAADLLAESEECDRKVLRTNSPW